MNTNDVRKILRNGDIIRALTDHGGGIGMVDSVLGETLVMTPVPDTNFEENPTYIDTKCLLDIAKINVLEIITS